MASADLVKLLDCSICLNVYTDPVNLKCGHNFCRGCIEQALNAQENSGGYSCPQCREEFQERPELLRNITLCSIVENFLSTEPLGEEATILCTYCVDSPVRAVKCCLHCDAALCNKHLKFHSKTPEHVLSNPSTALQKRKCPLHMKILEYYCAKDSTCICVSCRLDGGHQGHHIEMLDEAAEKKSRVRDALQKLTSQAAEAEKQVQSLQEHMRKLEQKAGGETERVTALFRDIRRQLDELERRVLSEISQQAKQLSTSLSDLIQKLEIKKEELSRKMLNIEEFLNTTDPLTILQGSDPSDLCASEELEDGETLDGSDLDVREISRTLHTVLGDILSGVMEGICMDEADDLSLDVNTAHNNLIVSHDRKVIIWSFEKQTRPDTLGRFQNDPRVLSCQSFSSGRHYWDVDVSKACSWEVGLFYPSVVRKGVRPLTDETLRFWCLRKGVSIYKLTATVKAYQSVNGRFIEEQCSKIRVLLDYEAGRISFYELSDPIRPLHSFSATFTEPLHVGISLMDFGSVKLSGGKNVYR